MITNALRDDPTAAPVDDRVVMEGKPARQRSGCKNLPDQPTQAANPSSSRSMSDGVFHI